MMMNEDDLGIFQNQKQVAENLKKSAESLGLEIDDATIEKLAAGTLQEVLVAKKNCKMCWGRGIVDFVPNQKNDTHNHSEPMKVGTWKDEHMVKAHCKCVRSQLL